jgi:hypothetical protein
MKMKENFKQPPCSTSPPGYPTWLKQYLSLTYVSSSYIFTLLEPPHFLWGFLFFFFFGFHFVAFEGGLTLGGGG